MPFQVFRRHQRKMLAVLAILAMGGFILADSGSKWMVNNAQGNSGRDEVVATLYGKTIRESDLGRLLSERQLANGTLAQLRPYFNEETFGPASIEEGVDSYILEHEAEAVGIPATPEMAKSWIFEQARQQHEFRRLLNRGIGPFEPRAVQNGLEEIYLGYSRSGQSGMTEAAFLQAIANQIRIAKVRELIAPALVTPLDAFEAYEDSELRVEARYASFRASDFLSKVGDPPGGDQELRAFYDRNKERLADPTRPTPGFRVPRRIRVEFLTLGLNAIDALRQKILQRPLAAELRAEETFAEVVARAYAEEQERPGPAGEPALPAFLFNDDPIGSLTPPSLPFVERYVTEQVNRQVEELLVEQIDSIFEGPRDAIYSVIERLESEGVELKSGRELGEDLTGLDEALSEAGTELRETLGPAATRPEGIGFTRIGMTRLLADPTVVRNLIGPAGVPPEWADYFELTGLDWSSMPLRRQALNLLESRSGLETPGISATTATFTDQFFSRGLGLLEPQEFADSLGRRYLAVKTLDLPERSLPFESAPKEVVLREWKLEQARGLAKDAAQALANKVREDGNGTPAEALDRVATAEGLTTTTTGQRVAADPLTSFAPIDASDDVRKAVFTLAKTGERRAEVAPDRSGNTYYVFALASRRDRTLPASAPAGEEVDFPNVLGSLTFYRSTADREAATKDAESVMSYLRKQAGLPEDWTPPESLRSEG